MRRAKLRTAAIYVVHWVSAEGVGTACATNLVSLEHFELTHETKIQRQGVKTVVPRDQNVGHPKFEPRAEHGPQRLPRRRGTQQRATLPPMSPLHSCRRST